jgi:hypothetical protein
MEVVEYSEEELLNGAIVALDQEKAYDKTSHRYLWETMKKLGIPEGFINTVKSLYSDTETHVVINREISSSFKIIREVRQGDPLFCLLFNLAIEPLARMLRQSNLKGYSVPHVLGKVVVKMYADDTTVYLDESDSFEELQELLRKWCPASGAKFNVSKTEVIPVGSPEYCSSMIQSRRLNDEDARIPSDIHIAKDGESVRILGSHVGNKIDNFVMWTPVVEK